MAVVQQQLIEVQFATVNEDHTSWRESRAQLQATIETGRLEDLVAVDGGEIPTELAGADQGSSEGSSQILSNLRKAEEGVAISEAKNAAAVEAVAKVVQVDKARGLDALTSAAEKALSGAVADISVVSDSVAQVVDPTTAKKGLNALLAEHFSFAPDQVARMTLDEKAEKLEEMENVKVADRERVTLAAIARFPLGDMEKALALSAENKKNMEKETKTVEDLGKDASDALSLKSDSESVMQRVLLDKQRIDDQLADSDKVRKALVQTRDVKKHALKDALRVMYACFDEHQKAELKLKILELQTAKLTAAQKETERRVQDATDALKLADAACDRWHDGAQSQLKALQEYIQTESDACANRAQECLEAASKCLEVQDMLLVRLSTDNSDRRSYISTQAEAAKTRCEQLDEQWSSGKQLEGGSTAEMKMAIGAARDKHLRHQNALAECHTFEQTIKETETLRVQKVEAFGKHSEELQLTVSSQQVLAAEHVEKCFPQYQIWFSKAGA